MNISINKDIERYKESIVMGLTAKQLIYSVIALALGAGIVLSTYKYVGLTVSVYIAIPVVAPIALDDETKIQMFIYESTAYLHFRRR